MSEENLTKIDNIINNLPEKDKQNYALKNYNDNLAYFRGIKTKEQLLSPEDYKTFTETNKEKLLDNGYYKTDIAGVYVKPTVGKTPEVKVEESPKLVPPLDPRANINALVSPEIIKRTKLPLLPDQSVFPPDALEPHTRITRRYENLDPFALGIEQAATESFRAENTALETINTLPDSQRLAVLSNLTANTQENLNKVITDTNVANAQNRQQTEQFNIGQSNNAENMRAVDTLDFERRQLTAKAKTLEDIRNYMDFNRKVQLGNFNTVTNLNILNDLYENYNFDPTNGIVFDNNGNQIITNKKVN